MTSIIGILHNNAKITVLTNSISSVDSSLLCSYVAEGERESMCSPMSLLIRTLILLMGPHSVTSFDLNYFLRDSVFKFSHIGVRASRPKFGGEGHTQSTTLCLQLCLPQEQEQLPK